MRRLLGVLAAAGLMTAAPAGAQVLDFENIVTSGNSYGEILEFYNGGTSSFGTSGPNYGISFFGNALAICGAGTGAGCTGNFDQNPSGNSVLFFLTSTSTGMNRTGGFTTGFSFYYSAAFDGSVSVYSGLNGTGTLLATTNFPATGQPGDLSCTASYCPWYTFGIGFAGTAQSIVFSGVANFVGFDDVTFGSVNPGETPPDGNVVPEPASLGLLATGLACVGLVGYRRRRRPAA